MALKSQIGVPRFGSRPAKLVLWIGLIVAFAAGCLGVLFLTNRSVVMDAAKSAYHSYKNRIQVVSTPVEPVYRADQQVAIFVGDLAKGWQDWSWAKHSIDQTATVFVGPKAIAMVPSGNKGVYLHHEPLNTDGYGHLQFYVNTPGDIKVIAVDGSAKFNTPVGLKKYLIGAPSRGWFLVRIPLADLYVPASGGHISGFVFQSATVSTQLPMYLDDITLQPDLSLPLPPTEVTIPVSIDPASDNHSISPYVYGIAEAPADYLSDLRVKLNRWGGEDKSRYNWVQGNAENSARDYYFENRVVDDTTTQTGPSSAADAFINSNLNQRCATIITVPALGWVAADADNNNKSIGVPNGGGTPLSNANGAIAGYDPTSNREKTSIPSLPRKPGPFEDPPTKASPVYQDEWVHHLVDNFGTADHGGVSFYAIDNEPDAWDDMHTDVHPARMGYDDVLTMFLNYATAVKDVDPTAQVTGPVSFGWTGYFYSSLDRGTDNFKTHADQNRHNGVPFLPWFLKQVHDHDVKAGRRTLDVLDIHYYPQALGVNSPDADDRDIAAIRLRSTRSLWDPTYSDESWIGERVKLIPRLHDWINQNYPGTKIGISEWNFGADQTMNGALAIADVLGIFGREGVYSANFWAYPAKDKPGYLAFKMFRNADDSGHGFGDISVHAVSSNPDSLSVFAARDEKSGLLTVIFINKLPRTSITSPITLASGLLNDRIVDQFQLSSNEPSGIVHSTTLRGVIPNAVTLPPYSITLYRIATGDTTP